MTPRDANRRAWLNNLSHEVIGAAITVRSRLGFGFLEKVYENAMVVELRKRGVRSQQQRPVHVFYDEEVVGVYVPDLLVEESLIVEIKTGASPGVPERVQCLNYLHATGLSLALLLNFGQRKVETMRFVHRF